MNQFTLNLNNNYQRPVLELKSWYNFEALLDTGAFFPVWVSDEGILKELGGKLVKKEVPFGGFGGDSIGNLYSLPSVIIGDLVFPNMSIIASQDLGDVPFQLILSATMFNDLIYEIDNKNHKMNVTIPDNESCVRNLRIKDSEGRLHILCTSDKDVGRTYEKGESMADLERSFDKYLKSKE